MHLTGVNGREIVTASLNLVISCRRQSRLGDRGLAQGGIHSFMPDNASMSPIKGRVGARSRKQLSLGRSRLRPRGAAVSVVGLGLN